MSFGLGLPPLAALSWSAWFRRRGDGRLDALLKASLAYVLLCFAFDEGLGCFHALAAPGLISLWILAAAAPLFLPAFPALHPFPHPPPPGGPSRRRFSRPELACLAVVGLIALICLALGFWIPQWNTDSLYYHLPRMEEWVQNRCLALFPAPYDLQDFFPPGAEYVSLQFRLLLGTQALAALGQWCAFVLSGAAVAALVRALGGGTRAQVLGLLAWATLPMAVLQSCTPQSDLMAAYGLILTAYFALRHDREPRAGWDLWAAAAAGAALMLKGTNYLFVPPFVLWVALRRDRRGLQAAGPATFSDRRAEVPGRRLRAARLALLALLAAAPSLPFWCRNTALCGDPLGGSTGMHGVVHPGPASLLSNGIKALGDELRVPSKKVNARTVKAVRWIHARLGLPMPDADRDFSTLPYDAYLPQRAAWHEDYAGEPLQTLALLALSAAALLRPRRRPKRYPAACLGGALLYLTLVRWNIWDTRLHLPLYACAAPLLGLGLDRLRRPALVWACAALLAGQGLWAACDNDRRPLFLLTHPYARLRGDYPGFVSGVNAARLGHSIGLLQPFRCCPEDGISEYGLWWGSQWAGGGVRIQHLTASPATSRLLGQGPWNLFHPDVLAADASAYKTPLLDWEGRHWRRLGSDGLWAVYLPVPPKTAPGSRPAAPPRP